METFIEHSSAKFEIKVLKAKIKVDCTTLILSWLSWWSYKTNSTTNLNPRWYQFVKLGCLNCMQKKYMDWWQLVWYDSHVKKSLDIIPMECMSSHAPTTFTPQKSLSEDLSDTVCSSISLFIIGKYSANIIQKPLRQACTSIIFW